MRLENVIGRLLLLAVFGAIVVPVGAQAPDCTGISGVFNTSSDFVNELMTIRVASGLVQPVSVHVAPGDFERLFVVEQQGRIKIVKNGVVQAALFLDITAPVACCGERGLLGLAFPSDYQTSGHFFVYYTANGGAITIERYTRMTEDLANAGSGQLVKSISHPISNHNGGSIHFGPTDGYLYISTGDGGSACDPGPSPGNAQNLTEDLGKMLRLDVSSLPATNPPDNPFIGGSTSDDDVWSYGLRNPYRWNFDRITASLYIGDVGQNAREEISCGLGSTNGGGGENYGWVPWEGEACNTCGEGSCALGGVPHAEPIRTYAWAGGRSAIGGFVYRGCRMGDLDGTYIYSDAQNGVPFIRTFRTDGNCSASGPVINPTPADIEREADLAPGGTQSINRIVGFGEDNQGELYIVDYDGEIYKIVPNLDIMELSGIGATQLHANANGDWVTEDLKASSGHIIRFYDFHRATSTGPGGPGPFTCVQETLNTPIWAGGDPTPVPDNEVFFYLVTAKDTSGNVTNAGVQSNGTPRVLSGGSCTL